MSNPATKPIGTPDPFVVPAVCPECHRILAQVHKGSTIFCPECKVWFKIPK